VIRAFEVAQQTALDDGAQGRENLGVAQHVRGHRVGPAVPRVQLTQVVVDVRSFTRGD
jgi:hypothetical protein